MLVFCDSEDLNDYESDAANIWKDNPNSTELVRRLKEIKGVGTSIANMIVNTLQRRGLINTDKMGIVICPANNSMRVLKRMELINNDSISNAIKVARDISPDYPGRLDKLFWEVGREYCLEDWKKCNICKLNKYCIRAK